MTNVRAMMATRDVTPLRDGGSQPAVVEADDDGLYVLKSRGAGRGRTALRWLLGDHRPGRGLYEPDARLSIWSLRSQPLPCRACGPRNGASLVYVKGADT